jgi:hypothetical protein
MNRDVVHTAAAVAAAKRRIFHRSLILPAQSSSKCKLHLVAIKHFTILNDALLAVHISTPHISIHTAQRSRFALPMSVSISCVTTN